MIPITEQTEVHPYTYTIVQLKKEKRTMVATENENAVSNLLAAYEGEMNAHARYKAYAAKAESEGLPGAASLFRSCGLSRSTPAIVLA